MHIRTALAAVLAVLAAASPAADAAIPSVIGPGRSPAFEVPINVPIVRPRLVPAVIVPTTPMTVVTPAAVPAIISPGNASVPVKPDQVQILLAATAAPFGWTHPDPHTWHRLLAYNAADGWRTADQRHWTYGPGAGAGDVTVIVPPSRSGLHPAADGVWPVAAPASFAGRAPKVWHPARQPGAFGPLPMRQPAG